MSKICISFLLKCDTQTILMYIKLNQNKDGDKHT